MNRESICKQQIHCLSCPLSVRITGKDCRTLTHKELIEMIVREPDNLCVICGAQIPEGRMICPICGTKDNIEGYAQLIRKPKPAPEFKVDDTQEQAFRQGYLTGFNEGMQHACIIKSDNERLKRENAFLRGQLEARSRIDDIDAEYE